MSQILQRVLQSRIAETATPLKLCVDAPLPFRVRQIGFPGHRERLDLGNQPLMQLPYARIQPMFDVFVPPLDADASTVRRADDDTSSSVDLEGRRS